MCRGSHGCGSPTVRNLRRRLLMRFTSSTARPFYNLRPLNAGGRTTYKKKAGTGAPALCSLARLPILAQEEQVQERQNSGQRRRDVGKGSRRKDPPGAVGLGVREDAIAGQEAIRPGGSVDLHR